MLLQEISINNIYNSTTEVVTFIQDRIPNLEELSETTFPFAILQVLTGSLSYKFGDNPTAKIFFRDITKLPSIVLVSSQGLEIGHTGIHYDEGSIVGALAKTFCKITIIGGSTYFFPVLINNPTGWMTLGTIGLASNFFCEPSARFFRVDSREYQTNCKNNTDCDMSYWEFAWENIGSFSLRSIEESIPKTFTSDVLVGNTLKPIFSAINYYTNYIATAFGTFACHKMFGIVPNNFNEQKGLFSKSSSCLVAANVSPIMIASTYAVFGSIEILTVTIREMITSAIFVPIVSSVADGPIPDWLFGSKSELTSTAIGASGTTACILITNFAFPLCIATGAVTKLAADWGMDMYYENTDESFLAGDNTQDIPIDDV